MKKIFAVVVSLLFFLPTIVHAQTKHAKPVTKPATPVQQTQTLPEPPNPYAAIDKRALQIPDSLTGTTEAIASYINANFNQSSEKVRAAFAWVAGSIRYDLANMYAINYYEKKEDKIAKPLQTRQGICENYSALFVDICQKLGIDAEVGFLRQPPTINDPAPKILHAIFAFIPAF